MQRGKAFRRHKADSHMRRRLKEDRNQHYNDLSCPCYTDLKIMAQFREQPKLCSCPMCGNPRKKKMGWEPELTWPELKNLDNFHQQMRDLNL